MTEIIEDVVNNCETCLKFKCPPPRPVVGLPKASQFNDTVSVDLHQLKPNLWYLHMIDEFTRFSNAAIISKKNDSMKAFILSWIGLFRASTRIFSDKGGEFISDRFYEMCEKFTIKVISTPSYSPWSNGLCERNNQFLTSILLKIIDDTNSPCDVALAWAINAKNSLLYHNGFSPSQLVYGRNSNLPNTISNNLPALETTTLNPELVEHIATLHAARKAFLIAKSSNKLKVAMRKQTRQSGHIYSIGDEVYHKRDKSNMWKGPSKVLGQDRPVVFLRHGSHYIKAHVCRVQPIKSNSTDSDKANSKPTFNTNKSYENSSNNNCSNVHNEESDDENPKPEIQATSDKTLQTNKIPEITEIANNNNSKMKLNSIITFKNPATAECRAKILSRAGKAKGKINSCYNIEYKAPENLRGKITSVYLNNIDILSVEKDDTNEENITANENNDEVEICNTEETFKIEEVYVNNELTFKNAKEKEIFNWKQNNVYAEVTSKNQKLISCRWVCTFKASPRGNIPKARLATRGFVEDTTNIFKDSPTCCKDTLRITLSIIVQNEWNI